MGGRGCHGGGADSGAMAGGSGAVGVMAGDSGGVSIGSAASSSGGRCDGAAGHGED